ncbi:hypothetical protein LQV63_30520 [Paenibacillus profundus]|uniref:Uncharacterized protein n=1 Tax=Paenibacillus profundus TaxID=1173085 RepID=A0ABS8YPS5_9BACL|nr:hypothetical protein [Paenibacillus profundus]
MLSKFNSAYFQSAYIRGTLLSYHVPIVTSPPSTIGKREQVSVIILALYQPFHAMI